MENSQLSKSRQTGSNEIRNERGMKIFQSVTLVFLALFWIGFAISYYRGIENNISTYGILILTFSLIKFYLRERKRRISFWMCWRKQKEFFFAPVH